MKIQFLLFSFFLRGGGGVGVAGRGSGWRVRVDVNGEVKLL